MLGNISRGANRKTSQDGGSWVNPVCEALIAAIMAGHLPPGAKLSEDAIGRIFKVSRTIVREALRQMAAVGLVTHLPNRGVFVAEPDPSEADSLYAARRLIELEVVADVACHCTAHDIRRLRKHIDAQMEAHQQDDRGAYIRLLGEFHVVLAGMCGNPVLCEFVGQLVPRSALITSLFAGKGPHICAMHEHTSLVDALEAGDVETSVAAMREHLTLRSQSLDMRRTKPVDVDYSVALAPYVKGVARQGRIRGTT